MELMNDFLKRLRDESGSISLVVMALFIVSLSSIFVITDVAAVAIAKRSLTQATEAAAQRGVRNLDKTSYYRGEFDATTQARNLFGIGPPDPGIPIDCSKALGDAEGALADWSSGPSSLRRVEITNLTINQIQCDGFGIQLITQATAKLPLVLPFFNLDSVEISSKVSTINTRAKGFSPFGIRIF
jgi:hypothetical protein